MSTPTERAIPTATRPMRILELDGLRAFAILPTMFEHFYPIGGWFGWTARIGKAGWSGVDLFFVLSGFLITGILMDSVSRPHYYRNFIMRRTLRIFPLYYVCLALFTAAARLSGGPEWAEMKQWGIGWFVVYLGNIRIAWLNSMPPIFSFSPLWSLQVEEQFYLLYPLIVLSLSRQNLRRFLLGCVMLAPLVRLLLALFTGPTTFLWAVYVLMPCRMDALALGGLVAILARSPSAILPYRTQVQWGAIVLSTATIGLFAWSTEAITIVAPYGFTPFLGYSLIGLTFATVLAFIVLWPSTPLAAMLRWRPLVYTGKIAYGLYLLNAPASWLARKAVRLVFGLNVDGHSTTSVLISFAATFLLADLSWRFFESPILSLKERFTSDLPEKLGVMSA